MIVSVEMFYAIDFFDNGVFISPAAVGITKNKINSQECVKC